MWNGMDCPDIEVFMEVLMGVLHYIPASILYKSIAGRYRPVSYPDGPMTARYRFIKNADWDLVPLHVL